jgi:hypothetical protein
LSRTIDTGEPLHESQCDMTSKEASYLNHVCSRAGLEWCLRGRIATRRMQ